MIDPLYDISETLAEHVLIDEPFSPQTQARVRALAVVIQRAITEWLVLHPAEPTRSLRAGDRVRFHSSPGVLTVTGVAADGMVAVSGFSGLFAPHLFEVIDAS